MELTLPLDYAAIERILPHRFPFLLVDRIIEFELDKRILQVKQQIQDFIKQNRLTSLNEANSENQRTLEKLRSDIAQTSADLSVAQSRRSQVEKKLNNETGYSDDDKRRAFAETWRQLALRIGLFANLSIDKLDGMSLQSKLNEIGKS